MPIFDYECRNCGRTFEEFVFSFKTPDEEIKCPDCGKNESQRKLSAPSIGKSTSAGNASSCGPGCGHSGFT